MDVAHFPGTTLVAADGAGESAASCSTPGVRVCDMLVLGFCQPSYELPAQAGRLATLGGDPPVVLTMEGGRGSPDGVGDAAWRPPARPGATPFARRLPLPCEDVRRRDAAAAIADGYGDIELLKRRTGAGTGPCQGKLCHAEMLACSPPPAGRLLCRRCVRCEAVPLWRLWPRRTAHHDRAADVIIVGGGITGLSLAVELARLGKREIVILEKRFTGAGGSGRNVGRIRAMQLTEELARFAIAAQAKHASLADELGANTLYWRAGYGWVLYEEIEMARMAEVRDMLRGLGLKPELIGAAETLRRLPVLAGGERPAGALMHRDAIVHHDAVL